MIIKTLLVAAFAWLAMPASAAAQPMMADEHRLSAAEVQKILDGAAARPVPPLAGPEAEEILVGPEPVHGELGVAIGTGGYREAFGTAVVPFGASGIAVLSFDSTDFGNRYSRRRR